MRRWNVYRTIGMIVVGDKLACMLKGTTYGIYDSFNVYLDVNRPRIGFTNGECATYTCIGACIHTQTQTHTNTDTDTDTHTNT